MRRPLVRRAALEHYRFGADPLRPLGFVLYLRRLEKRRFQLAVIGLERRHVEREAAQLATLLYGIGLNAPRLGRRTPPQNRAKGLDTDLRVLAKLVDGHAACRSRMLPDALIGFVTELADRLAKLEHENAQL